MSVRGTSKICCLYSRVVLIMCITDLMKLKGVKMVQNECTWYLKKYAVYILE